MIFLILLLVLAALTLLVLILFSSDIKAAKERDPAARGALEVLLLYPNIHAMVIYRLARFLWARKIPFLPRFLSQIGRFLTGIEIHPGASIGKGFFIDHGMGVVIGETTIIGNNVTLFQGVTLGGTGKETGKRHPTLGNNIVVGAGAKVLGNITVGDNSYVGANAVVIKDVPANSTIVGVPGHTTRQEGKKLDILMDHIHVTDPMTEKLRDLHKRIQDLEEKTKS